MLLHSKGETASRGALESRRLQDHAKIPQNASKAYARLQVALLPPHLRGIFRC